MAPQFFLLVGIDVFLGTSILTVMLDDLYPAALAYFLQFGSLTGFSILLVGPQYLAGIDPVAQFYYSFGYTLVSVFSLLGVNLYLPFIKKRTLLGGVVAVAVTIPAFLATAFFENMFVSNVPLDISSIPVVPMSLAYALFGGAAALVVIGMVVSRPRFRTVWKQVSDRAREVFKIGA